MLSKLVADISSSFRLACSVKSALKTNRPVMICFCVLLYPEPAEGGVTCRCTQQRSGEVTRKKRRSSACRPTRWARRRTSTWGRPACFSRTSYKPPLAKGLFRPSASSADSWNWILWTTATSTAPWRLQSAHGRSNPCGPNWTKEHNKRFTTRIRPARAPG